MARYSVRGPVRTHPWVKKTSWKVSRKSYCNESLVSASTVWGRKEAHELLFL